MRRLTALVALLLVAVPASGLGLPGQAPPSGDGGSSAQAPSGGYELFLQCMHDKTRGDPREPYVFEGCPLRAHDEQDLLGQPVLVVDPTNPEQFSFAALHGGVATGGGRSRDGPTERSRTGQAHTTWRSTDMGRSWDDLPWEPEEAGLSDRYTYGEHVAGVMDRSGSYYLSALYSHRDRRDAPFNWTLAFWQWDHIGDVDAGDGYSVGVQHYSAPVDGRIRNPWMVNSPTTGRVAATWWETDGEEGRGRLALTDHETRRRNATDDGGNATGNSTWRVLPPSQAMAPCTYLSNSVEHDGYVYNACVRPSGNVDIYRTDLATRRVLVRSTAPMQGGRPHLAITHDGWTALVTVAVEAPDQVQAQLTYGWDGAGWSPPTDITSHLRNGSETDPVLEARVQDMVLRPDTGSVHILYLERYDRTGRATPDGLTNLADPEYGKALVAFHKSQGFLKRIDLAVGNGANRREFDVSRRGIQDGAFNDLRDSLVVVNATGDNPREFIMYNDYGVVAYSEVIEDAPGLGIPGPPAAPPGVTPAPAGSAAGASSGSLATSRLLFGLAAGGLSLAMVARLLVGRSEHRAPAPSKDE